jgi:hypothetical protein
VRSDGIRVNGSTGTTSSRLDTGSYRVTFPTPVSTCALSIDSAQYLGSGLIGIGGGTNAPQDVSHQFFTVVHDLQVANSVRIGERNTDGTLVDGPFSISMICA